MEGNEEDVAIPEGVKVVVRLRPLLKPEVGHTKEKLKVPPCDAVVTMLLHCCYNVVTLLFTVVTLLLHSHAPSPVSLSVPSSILG
jgi:hypothetical protein